MQTAGPAFVVLLLRTSTTVGVELFGAVPGDAPAARERLLFHAEVPTLAETLSRRIWVESTGAASPLRVRVMRAPMMK